MELDLLPGDYRDGDGRIRFTVHRVVDFDTDWVMLTGVEQPGEAHPWRPCCLQVRVTALKRSLARI